jgi:CBS domain-containing protein
MVEHYRTRVTTVPEGTLVPEIAEALERESVAGVIVVDRDGQPLGLVTDRDLALRVVAAGRDPATTTAAAIMSHPVRTVHAADSVERAVEQMAVHGVRRLPVTDGNALVGMVSLDDLMSELGSELEALGKTHPEGSDGRDPPRRAQFREELESRIEAFRGRLGRLGSKRSHALVREFDALRDWLRQLVG